MGLLGAAKVITGWAGPNRASKAPPQRQEGRIDGANRARSKFGRFARTIQTVTTAKTISEDSAFIDYTRGNLGVRVWKDRCQTIARDGDGQEWQGRERQYPPPIDPEFHDLPLGGSLQPVPAITFEIALLGSIELSRLTAGELSFDQALAGLAP